MLKYKSLHQHHGLLATTATLPKLILYTNRPDVTEKQDFCWLAAGNKKLINNKKMITKVML